MAVIPQFSISNDDDGVVTMRMDPATATIIAQACKHSAMVMAGSDSPLAADKRSRLATIGRIVTEHLL